ncbi:GMP synthase [Bisporella sp. PMI_857]|nr:GMP synthase [Bisporella sp. PMI_857]
MVIETDEPHPDTIKERGSFSHILYNHFVKAGNNHDPPLGIEVEQRFVVAEKGGKVPLFEEFKDINSVLITGSVFDAYSDNPWILELLVLLQELYTKRPDIKLSGICFGHQLICRLLGSKVEAEPSGDWELGHCPIQLTPMGKRLFRTEEDKIYLHQIHQDQVVSPPLSSSSGGLIPEGTKVHVWGSSVHTQMQGVFIANRVFTTQAHLAFDESMVHRQIQMRVDRGSVQDIEHADRAKETAHLEHDGNVVAAAILRFLYGEDSDIDKQY